jgi:peptidoglycan/xylan/chitin deacetylase (PgdA/CDA1 family)
MGSMAKDQFLVLMYHRVIPRRERDGLQPGMYVEPASFDAHLDFFSRHFEIRSVSELCTAAPVVGGQRRKVHACYLTFDDGWADFYRYAFPLLVKHQVPATVFLPTGFVGTARRFWTERLGLLCAAAMQRGTFAALGDYVRQSLSLSEVGATQVTAFQEQLIQCLKAFRLVEIEGILGQLESLFGVIATEADRDFLSWEEIEEMQRSGLVTFGSHTENHLLLTTLCDREIQCELVNSKQALLARRLGTMSNLSFCYPNGNYNAVAISELDRSGYGCAFTTRSGWNTPATPRFELNRVGVHQDIAASEALLSYRIFSAPTA